MPSNRTYMVMIGRKFSVSEGVGVIRVTGDLLYRALKSLTFIR